MIWGAIIFTSMPGSAASSLDSKQSRMKLPIAHWKSKHFASNPPSAGKFLLWKSESHPLNFRLRCWMKSRRWRLAALLRSWRGQPPGPDVSCWSRCWQNDAGAPGTGCKVQRHCDPHPEKKRMVAVIGIRTFTLTQICSNVDNCQGRQLGFGHIF